MATERSGLTMLAVEQLAIDHGSAADPTAQCDHDRIARTLRGAEGHLAQQRHARVILNREGQTKAGPAPRGQIQIHRVIKFLAGGEDSLGSRIHDPAKAKGQPFAVEHREIPPPG